jgi:aquaporin Z
MEAAHLMRRLKPMTTSSTQQAASRTVTNVASAQPLAIPRVQAGPAGTISHHWPEYLMEGAGLGFFMISACAFGALYEFPGSPVRQAITSDFLRRLLMGISMGLTAIAIIYSPWGKQSGAHINPSITLTFLRLGKIKMRDGLLYVVAQFAGAILGVALVTLLLGRVLAHPAVRFAVTVPGSKGVWVALGSEFLIAFGMMSLVLHFSNHHRLARYTGLFAGVLIATYITLEAPFSGMSMNPARTAGSAFSAGIWDALWIYFTAPPAGMLVAAELYLWRNGKTAVKCCKLHHNNSQRCIFCGANGGFAA